MNFDKDTYKKYAYGRSKKSSVIKNTVWAFITGGLICDLGQLIKDLYSVKFSENTVKMLVPVTLIFLASLFSGLGLFDRLAKHAGAGTLVPITGFSNAVISPALDYKAEGMVLGLGAKMFIIAGPVIVYGVLASVICGIAYYVIKIL